MRKILPILTSKWFVVILSLLLVPCLNVLSVEKVSAQKCSGGWDVTDVSGLKPNYQPKELIQGSFNYRLNNSPDCPNCVQQLVVGIVDQSGVKVKDHTPAVVYKGTPKVCPDYTSSSSPFSFNFQLALNPGAYRIIACNYINSSYDESRQNFPAEPNNTKLLKQITVGGTPPLPPVITFFTASATAINSGQSSTLRWDVTGANSVSINQGIGTVPLSGTKVVTPTATTTYTLTATNNDGSTTASTTITVNLNPIWEFFKNILRCITQNQNTILSVIAFLLMGYFLLRYFVKGRRGRMDRILSLAIVIIAGVYLIWIHIVPPVVTWISRNVVAIVLTLIVIIAVLVVILKKTIPRLPTSSAGITKTESVEQMPHSSEISTDLGELTTPYSDAMNEQEGYIYIARCDYHATDVYKIGRSKDHPKKRMEEISRSTGVPEPYRLVEHWKVTNQFQAESLVHDALREFRFNPQREFFQVRLETLFRVIPEVIKDMRIDDERNSD